MDVSKAPRLRAMKDENRRLKLAEPARRGAEGRDPKKRLELAGLREEVAFVSVQFRLSERTACKLSGVERSSYRYESRPRTGDWPGVESRTTFRGLLLLLGGKAQGSVLEPAGFLVQRLN